MLEQKSRKIVLPGGAGLVGHNLVSRLKEEGYSNIVVLDKHRANLEILRSLHPDIAAEYADLADAGEWQVHFDGADVVVMLQAQIGGLYAEEFDRNNVIATDNILKAMEQFNVPRLIHISSSVLESIADDFYTESKRIQEERVLACNIPHIVLRPTLMFGWFDRKHLGWLSRFMKRSPFFPIPGHGRYMRQPLYVGDFCQIIITSIREPTLNGVFNISGLEKIDYIAMIKEIRSAIGSRTLLIQLPYRLFYFLLWLWSRFDSSPPFTTQQLAALTADDEFEVIDWPTIFGVTPTPFRKAISETYNDSRYSDITLVF